MSQIILTIEGEKKLKKELAERKIQRKKIAAKIETAKELGDLSENAEYHDAKDQQGLNESKIIEIKAILANAVISNGHNNSGTVGLGSTIKVKTNEIKRDFIIVGFNEANPAQGKISNESPLAQAFLNKKKGDIIEIEVPRGKIKYTILEIQ